MNGNEAVKALMDGEKVYPIIKPRICLKLDGCRIEDDHGNGWSIAEVLETPSAWKICRVPTLAEKYPYGTIVEACDPAGIWHITYSMGEMKNNRLWCSSSLYKENSYTCKHIRPVNIKTDKEK